MPPVAGARLSTILNADGTIPAGVKGSFNADGYTLTTTRDGRPSFQPRAARRALGAAGVGDDNWSDDFAVNGTSSIVLAAVVDNGGNLYVGGDFDSAGNVPAANIAKWDGTSWRALGAGVDGMVQSLAVDNLGNLYASGGFSMAGNTAANLIAKWNGSTWSALGSGLNGPANALAVDNANNLYAGGGFTMAGGSSASHIARWNGSTWSPVGTGTNGAVMSLVCSGSTVFAGGQFTTAGGASASNVARWTGTAWTGLGSGVNSAVTTLKLDSSGSLYVGGSFTMAGAVSVSRIAKWNGVAWTSLGSGINGWVQSITLDTFGNIYAGGEFTMAGNASALNVARWNGSSWSAMGAGLAGFPNNNQVKSLVMLGANTVFAGGFFSHSGSTTAYNIARWTVAGTSWAPVTTLSPTGGLSSAIGKMATDGSGNLYAGGIFTAAGNTVVNNVARWNGSSWAAMGSGVNGQVRAVATDGNGNVYVGGSFTIAGNISARRVAKWNGTSWSAMGTGMPFGVVHALTCDASGNVYAAGEFTEAGDIIASNIAKWNGVTWSALGSGLNDGANAVVTDAAGNVYVGGRFTSAGGVSASRVAKWNGTAWSALGAGTNNQVHALALDNSGSLYAGGDFSTAGGIAAQFIARWNGTAWSALGSGTSATVYTLLTIGNNVFAGGQFASAGGVAVKHVAKWDGTAWSSLGTGTNGQVYTLAAAGTTGLYVGGNFATVGDGSKVMVNLGRYTLPILPVLSSISPGSGPAGLSVTLTGANLSGTIKATFTSSANVATEVLASSFTSTSYASAPNTIGLNVPLSLGQGIYTVTVTTAQGSSNSVSFNVTRRLVISTGTLQSPVQVAAGTYSAIVVTSTGVAELGGAVQVDSAVVVRSGGTLLTSCQPLTGVGRFTLEPGATLGICDLAGLSSAAGMGAVRVTGTRTYSDDASYLFNNPGLAAQVTGDQLPATVRNLVVSRGSGAATLALSQPVQIRQEVRLDLGNLLLNGHNLTLLSSATGTALVVNTGNAAVIGNTATMQRYLTPNNPGLGYRHYSSPVSGNSLTDLATATFTPRFNAAYNTSLTPGQVVPFPTVFGYDQSRLTMNITGYTAFDKGWYSPSSGPASTPDSFITGRGYTVQLPGTEVVDFTGTLNNGDYQLTLARNMDATGSEAGFHLVGNPYPAPLDWSQVDPADRPGLDASMYVYASSGPYTGFYRAYVNGIGGPSALIGSSQGFFVRVSSFPGMGSITFRNSQRVTDFNTQVPMYRATADTRPQLQLALRGNGLADELYVYAQTGASSSVEAQMDAIKMPNTAGLNLASLASTGEALSIDARPDFSTATLVPLTVSVPQVGAYSFEAKALANMAGTAAYLRDAATGARTLLTQGTVYSFRMTGLQAPGRFFLELGAASAPLAATGETLQAAVLLYPNPARSVATVVVPAVAGSATASISLVDALGRVVLARPVSLPASGASVELSLNGIAPGVYAVRIEAGTQVAVRRLVVQ